MKDRKKIDEKLLKENQNKSETEIQSGIEDIALNLPRVAYLHTKREL